MINPPLKSIIFIKGVKREIKDKIAIKKDKIELMIDNEFVFFEGKGAILFSIFKTER